MQGAHSDSAGENTIAKREEEKEKLLKCYIRISGIHYWNLSISTWEESYERLNTQMKYEDLKILGEYFAFRCVLCSVAW